MTFTVLRGLARSSSFIVGSCRRMRVPAKRVFLRTWTRGGLSFSRRSGSEHRPRKQVSLSGPLVLLARNSLPLPAGSPWTGERIRSRWLDPLTTESRCHGVCDTGANDDTREYPPRGSSFSLSLSLARLSHWPSLASHARSTLAREEPTRVPEAENERRVAVSSRDAFRRRVSRGWHLNGQLPKRKRAGRQLPLCPGLVASRLPRLPSSTWDPSAWRWFVRSSTMPPISGVLL